MTDLQRTSFVSRVRMNHGLEHATINVLEKKYPGLHLAGYSTPYGFSVVGALSLELLIDGIREAQNRIAEGNRSLVIHERCGTNLATGGILTAFAAWLAMQGTRRGLRAQLERLPLVMILTTIALYFAPYLGVKVQQRITTSSEIQNLEVASISKGRWGKQTRFLVKTRFAQTHG